MVAIFLDICSQIGCPIADEKTEWATQWIVFLGILLNGRYLNLAIPIDKISKARELLVYAIEKGKVTVCDIQKLTGTFYLSAQSYHSRQGIHERDVSTINC